MTAPTEPDDDPRFVTSDDVVARFAGTFPAARVTWVQWRILDVENELINRVPSVALLNPTNTDLTTVEGRRLRSVKTLIVDKVLELFDLAKAKGGTSLTSEMDGFRTTIGFGQNRDNARGTGVRFTEEELNRVRIRKPRSRFGTIAVGPGMFRPC